MYVVSLIIDGELKKNAIRGNANDAVSLAHEWVKQHKQEAGRSGYIAIDEQAKDQQENHRFAEIKFDDEPDKVKLYLRERDEHPLFSSRFTPVLKSFVFTVVEFALVKLTEYLKSNKNGRI